LVHVYRQRHVTHRLYYRLDNFRYLNPKISCYKSSKSKSVPVKNPFHKSSNPKHPSQKYHPINPQNPKASQSTHPPKSSKSQASRSKSHPINPQNPKHPSQKYHPINPQNPKHPSPKHPSQKHPSKRMKRVPLPGFDSTFTST
jgi:hypothetical protein